MRLRKGTERVSFRLSDVNIAICDLVIIEFELELELLFASIFCLEYFLFNKYMQYANLLGIPKIWTLFAFSTHYSRQWTRSRNPATSRNNQKTCHSSTTVLSTAFITKGQIISEWLLDVFIWTKETNEIISVFLL